jgi:ferredoxin-NADP reductase
MELKLISKENLAGNVWAFRFKPQQSLSWTAGQYIKVELPHDNPDDEGASRYFTISSAPYEGIVQITTRVTDSSFKKALAALPESGNLQLMKEPGGDFVWEDSDKPMIFIAGGIGMTPFYSILKQRHHDQQALKVMLIYGSRDDEVPFKEELAQWQAADPEFKISYQVGVRLTPEVLKGIAPGLNESMVYLSGPESMVEALGDQLKAAGLPEAQLKQDYFPNYTEENY